MDHYPVQLSGGAQQRVALARAFILRRPSSWPMSRPAIWIRPTARNVLELLLKLKIARGHDAVAGAHALCWRVMPTAASYCVMAS